MYRAVSEAGAGLLYFIYTLRYSFLLTKTVLGPSVVRGYHVGKDGGTDIPEGHART